MTGMTVNRIISCLTLRTQIGLVLIISSIGTHASAQGDFDTFLKEDAELQAQTSASLEEIRKFEEVLNGEDADRAMRAMRFMLASGKPALVRRAREFGAYSVEPLFREEFLRATFDQGGPFQMVVDLGSEADEENDVAKILVKEYDGSLSSDKQTVSMSFFLSPYDEEKRCWKFGNYNLLKEWCAIYLTGDSVSLQGWRSLTGELSLDDKGTLEGTVQGFKGEPKRARIVLIE